MHSLLLSKGLSVEVINTAAQDIVSTYSVRAKRAGRIIQGLYRFLRLVANKRVTSAYLSISGGYGRFYDVAFILLARVFGCKIILHHHSFAYLDAPDVLASWIVRAAGKNAMHLVLCDAMETALRGIRPMRAQTLAISNAVFVGDPLMHSRKERVSAFCLGFLSNVSRDKGILEFMAVVDGLAREGMKLRARVAGPIVDGAIAERLHKWVREQPSVEYLGVVDGENKERFFQSIDVLLFPTNYRNEAEPLTILEAMSKGIPVIAKQRGCIGSLLSGGAGVCVFEATDFVEVAKEVVRSWSNCSTLYEGVCEVTRERYQMILVRSRAAFENFLAALS